MLLPDAYAYIQGVTEYVLQSFRACKGVKREQFVIRNVGSVTSPSYGSRRRGFSCTSRNPASANF